MKTSDETHLLYSALNSAQSQFNTIPQNCENPYFRSTYASLTDIWRGIRETLALCGLAVIQGVRTAPAVKVEALLTTRLCHTSGQWIEDDGVPLIVEGNNKRNKTMQSQGSAITYARRQGLGAMLGIITDQDDDAAVASDTLASRTKPKGGKATPKVKALKGPIKTLSELKSRCREMAKDISLCTDTTMLSALETSEQCGILIKQLKIDLPDAYDSPRNEKTGFVGIKQLFEETQERLEQ
jgi:hypothetical protein|tara:strand:- start:2108 stop:2827 length:720 start_codon:yes stop_codon:yes gene_type:complete